MADNLLNLDSMRLCFDQVFPKFEPRPGQLESSLAIIKAFEDGGKRHVILEAPTGAGKSVILAIVFEWYAAQELRCVATTVTKALQQQYQRDFAFADIKSSSNEEYRCKYGFIRPEIECMAKQLEKNCKNKTDCKYSRAINHFMKSRKALTNLQFACRIPMLNNPYLLAIDECHEIAGIVTGAFEIKYREQKNIESLLMIIRSKEDYEKFCSLLLETEKTLQSFKVGEVFKFPKIESAISASNILDRWLRKTAQDAQNLIDGSPTLKSAFRTAKGLDNSLNGVLDAFDKLFCTEEKYTFSPVYASEFTNRMIYSKAAKILHMSATVCGFEAYCEEVGIPLDIVEFVNMDHVIPVENRPIKIRAAANMTFRDYDSNVKDTAKAVDFLIAKHKGLNTLIHTVSYKRAEDVAKLSKNNILVPRSHFEAVKMLQSAKSGVYVASPSLSAGIDAKDDMCRLNIICKMPYPSLGSAKMKYLLKYENRLYSLAVARDVVQASGRGTRHEKDWSTTYIIDGTFNRFARMNGEVLPEWFNDAVKYE